MDIRVDLKALCDTEFGELSIGDIFFTPTDDERNVPNTFMKIICVKNDDTSDPSSFNAVNLFTGDLIYIYKNDLVLPLEGGLDVKPKNMISKEEE